MYSMTAVQLYCEGLLFTTCMADHRVGHVEDGEGDVDAGLNVGRRQGAADQPRLHEDQAQNFVVPVGRREERRVLAFHLMGNPEDDEVNRGEAGIKDGLVQLVG